MNRERKKRLLQAVLVLGILLGAFVAFLLVRPPCVILQTTGLYCGGCGGSRMIEEFLRGNLWGAFRQNPYLFFALPRVGVYCLGEGICYVWEKRPLWKRRWIQIGLGVLVAVGLIFTLLRNLSGFEMLRPR